MTSATLTTTQPQQAAQRVGADLLARLDEARRRTDRLFALVPHGAMYERPIAERHRLAFYRGHVEAFDWNLLREPLLDDKAFAPGLDRLFAFGIDPVGTALPSDKVDDWPRLDEIERYNATLRERIDGGLARWCAQTGDARASGDDDPALLINMAIEHRLMHAETLAYLLHRLPFERKRVQPQVDVEAGAPFAEAVVDVPAGTVTLGRDRDGRFGWDNEFDALSIDVPSFAIDRYMVTNGQYLRFVEAGGYGERVYWSDADWQWKAANGIEHPAFWMRDTRGWKWRGMFDARPLPADCPST